MSGNPAGRPKGSRNRLTVLRESLVSTEDAREIVAKIVEQAKGGDMQAAGMLLERFWPKLRPQAPSVALELPDADLMTQANFVLRELGAGTVPPEVAAQVLGSLAAVGRLKETTEFEERLARLEKRQLLKGD